MEEPAPYHPLLGEIGVADDSRLNELGYKQELSRSLSAISNFAVTFSIISVITGISTTFNTGLEFGGPMTMIYGWPIAGAFTLIVGLSMAEICSSYPTSGGLYFWSAKLSGQQWGPFASWITGWMAYAFSRDGAMPVSSLWHKVNKQEVPINAVWLSVFISFCMALPSLGSLVAFQAMVSIATIGLYIAYAFPIFFRITLARKTFIPGPFNLGRYGVLIGTVAVLWVTTITVLFSLPVAYPVTKDTLNYTPVAVGGLLILTISSWIFSARHWFKGPITNIDM